MSFLNKLKSNASLDGAMNTLSATISESMEKALSAAKDSLQDDQKYLTYVAGPIFKMLPLPVQLIGKERLKYDPIMLDIKNEAVSIESNSVKMRPNAKDIIVSIVKKHYQA